MSSKNWGLVLREGGFKPLTSSPKLYIVSPRKAEMPRSCARCRRSSGVRSVAGSMQARNNKECL